VGGNRMQSTPNPKRLAAAAVVCIASVFMLTAFTTLDHIPSAFYVVYVAAMAVGGFLMIPKSKISYEHGVDAEGLSKR
jgi:hypothetical protein